MSDYITNPEEVRDYAGRFRAIYIFVFITFGIFSLRLIWLQLVTGHELRGYSESNRVKQMRVFAPRGQILDRDGRPLVENLPGFEAIVNPQYIDDMDSLAEMVAPLIQMDPARLVDKIQRSRRVNGAFATVRLKENLSREEVFRLKRIRLDIPGLEIRESILRNYPLGENGAQVFGYVGEISKREIERLNKRPPEQNPTKIQFQQGDIIGKKGIEEYLESKIRGTDGVNFIQVDAHGRETVTEIPNIYGEQIQDIEPAHGNSAILTIDKDIQEAAFASMLRLERIGAVVAMKTNGEILAMINTPSYDPNYFATDIPTRVWNKLTSDPFKPLRNKVLQDHFSPGSTFKPFVGLAALQEGVITDKTRINSPGRLFFGNRWYHNHKKEGDGQITVYEAVERSSNVFFYQLGIKLGVDKMYNLISLLGLGTRTGIEFDRDVPGRLPNSEWKKQARGEPWQPGENLSTAIGQGYVTVSPMQMAIAYNTIATEGKVVKPYVVSQITDLEGKLVAKNFPTVVRDVTLPQPNGFKIDAENFKIMKEALRRVSNGAAGTARQHKVPGVELAGKTGTSQVMNFSADQIYIDCKSRPIQMRHHGWFVGWAPADKPEITIAVLAQHSCSGSGGAAPIFRDIAEAYFKKYHPELIAEGLKKAAAKKPPVKPVEAAED